MRRFDVRAVSHRQLREPGPEQSSELAGRRDGERVEGAVHYKGRGKGERGRGVAQLWSEIVFPQTAPHSFLRARRDAKCREVPGVADIAKVACDRQLQCPALVGRGIALAQTAAYQRRAFELSVAGYFRDVRDARNLTAFRM